VRAVLQASSSALSGRLIIRPPMCDQPAAHVRRDLVFLDRDVDRRPLIRRVVNDADELQFDRDVLDVPQTVLDATTAIRTSCFPRPELKTGGRSRIVQ
jgi:hypothetical protein